MDERLRAYLDHILGDVPMSGKAQELKEELLGNMKERFRDLTVAGCSEDDAFRITVEAMGDIRGLFVEFAEPDTRELIPVTGKEQADEGDRTSGGSPNPGASLSGQEQGGRRLAGEERGGSSRVTEEERRGGSRVTGEERRGGSRVTGEERRGGSRVTGEERGGGSRITEEERGGGSRVTGEERRNSGAFTGEEGESRRFGAEKPQVRPVRGKSHSGGLIALAIVLFMVVGSAVIGTLLFGSGHSSGGQAVLFGYHAVQLVNTQEVDMDGVEELLIKYDGSGMDINFHIGDSDKLVIKEYMYQEASDGQLARISEAADGTRMEIVTGRKRGVIVVMGIMTGSERVEVYLPKSYHAAIRAVSSSGDIYCSEDLTLEGGLKAEASSGDITFRTVTSESDVEISTHSGSITMQSVTAEEITASATSGDITIRTAEGNRTISTNSGDIYVEGGSGDSQITATSGEITASDLKGMVQASAGSGDIRLRGVEGDVEISTTSGDITVDNLRGAAKVECSSGDVRLKADEITGEVRVSTTSGTVNMEIPEETPFSFLADTNSGEISTFFDNALSFNKKGNHAEGQVGDSPDITMTVKTSSGDVRIRKR